MLGFIAAAEMVNVANADVGDAALALSCMLALGPSADPNDTKLLQGLSFAASRSVLLLRMFASSLQVIHCLLLYTHFRFVHFCVGSQ